MTSWYTPGKRIVLTKFREYHLYIKAEVFISPELSQFLGYIITAEGIKMDVQAIKSWPEPTTTTK